MYCKFEEILLFSSRGIAVGCAHPSGALETEKYFSDAHVVRKMI